MLWFIAALLIYPTGQEHIVYNQSMWFYDQQSCWDYITGIGLEQLVDGVKMYLDQSMGIDHGITVDKLFCDGYDTKAT